MIKRCSSCSGIQPDEKVLQCRNCGMPFEGYSPEVGTAQALHQIARNTGTMKNIMLMA